MLVQLQATSQQLASLTVTPADLCQHRANYFWSAATRQPMVNAFTGTQGPTNEVIANDLESPYEFFKVIFIDALMELTVEQTNLYASQYIAANHLSPHCIKSISGHALAEKMSRQTFINCPVQ